MAASRRCSGDKEVAPARTRRCESNGGGGMARDATTTKQSVVEGFWQPAVSRQNSDETATVSRQRLRVSEEVDEAEDMTRWLHFYRHGMGEFAWRPAASSCRTRKQVPRWEEEHWG